MKLTRNQVGTYIFVLIAVWMLQSCYSPSHSQEYFIEASLEDPALEPLYTTSLYTVYYDHALVRCVLHSTHTWGQNGGGGGGTGIGVQAFRCDPDRIRQRAESVGLETYEPKIRRSRPERRERRSAISPEQERTIRTSPGQEMAPAAPPPNATAPSGQSPERPVHTPIIRGAE